MDQVDAAVRAKALRTGETLVFEYSLENRRGAAAAVARFAIEASRNANNQPLRQIAPVGWQARGPIADTAMYVWRGRGKPRGLRPGASVSGFQLESQFLPGLRTYLAWNDVELPSFPEGMAPDACEGSDILENSFKGKTIGPKAPPGGFVPLEFVNYLIALLHDSREQGWVRRDGIHQSLLAKLLAAKRALEDGRLSPAQGALKAFLHEVEAVSCAEFSCPGNRPLTSEAYALLYFNGQYLAERLGGTPAPR